MLLALRGVPRNDPHRRAPWSSHSGPTSQQPGLLGEDTAELGSRSSWQSVSWSCSRSICASGTHQSRGRSEPRMRRRLPRVSLGPESRSSTPARRVPSRLARPEHSAVEVREAWSSGAVVSRPWRVVKTEPMRYALPHSTLSERAGCRRWWIERSGLFRAGLVSIAIGLGGDAGSRRTSDSIPIAPTRKSGSGMNDTPGTTDSARAAS